MAPAALFVFFIFFNFMDVDSLGMHLTLVLITEK
jgi:hypothetical protein